MRGRGNGQYKLGSLSATTPPTSLLATPLFTTPHHQPSVSLTANTTPVPPGGRPNTREVNKSALLLTHQEAAAAQAYAQGVACVCRLCCRGGEISLCGHQCVIFRLLTAVSCQDTG